MAFGHQHADRDHRAVLPARTGRQSLRKGNVAGQEAAARWVEPSFPTRAATLRLKSTAAKRIQEIRRGTSRLQVTWFIGQPLLFPAFAGFVRALLPKVGVCSWMEEFDDKKGPARPQ